jgi:hypothetical protein
LVLAVNLETLEIIASQADVGIKTSGVFMEMKKRLRPIIEYSAPTLAQSIQVAKADEERFKPVKRVGRRVLHPKT